MRHQFGTIVLLTLCLLGVSACATMQISPEIRVPAKQMTSEPSPVAATATISTPLTLTTPITSTVMPVLAYVYGGDIWVKSLPNGETQQLTKDGINQSPQWSPSGQWLTFVKNPDAPELWAIQSNGANAQQIDSAVAQDAYAWSPVEDKLALAKGAQITFYSFQSGAAAQAEGMTDVGVPESNGTVNQVAWSSSGQQLAFTLSLPLSSTGSTPQVNKEDGLWTLEITENKLAQVVESGVPEKGQIILHGWSSDGKSLLYWQGVILSASLMADGVSLYSVPAAGGTPLLLADSVLVHDDAVQSRPHSQSNRQPQVAVIAGAGRQVWSNKSLVTVAISGTQSVTLTTQDRAAASPAWSPNGDAIAYISMPDAGNVDGGPEAQVALNQRQLWLVDSASGSAQNVEMSATVREEGPLWIDQNTLLVARMDANGEVSLWEVSRAGGQATKVVDEITPAPDWFGYYGYIDWRQYYSLRR
jgi:Tol biopolymer transport system component